MQRKWHNFVAHRMCLKCLGKLQEWGHYTKENIISVYVCRHVIFEQASATCLYPGPAQSSPYTHKKYYRRKYKLWNLIKQLLQMFLTL